MYPPVTDIDVNFALDSVKRADFLPLTYQSLGEEDQAIPYGDGITVPPRSYTALVMDLLDLKHNDKVMEIGTGSGYQTKVLSILCAEVHSCDICKIPVEVLELLPEHVLCYPEKDGRYPFVFEKDFDAVLVTAGSDKVYDFWADSLADGGRLVVPIGEKGVYEVRKYVKHKGRMEDMGPFGLMDFVPLRRS